MNIRKSRSGTGAEKSASVPDETSRSSRPKRRPLRAALLVVVAAGVCWAYLGASAAWRQTQLREAYLPELQAQAAHDPNNGPLQALLGGRLMEAAEYADASEALHRAVSDGEQNAAVWQCMAAAVAASGDSGRALADLKIALQSNPPVSELKPVYEDARAVGRSAPPQQLAVTISPLGAQPLVDRYAAGSFLNGVAEWWGRHHPEESGFSTRRAWAIAEPTNAVARRLWGEALIKNRRPPEAIDAFHQAVDLDPKSAENHLALADALAAAGNDQAAMLQYIECLKLRKDWLPALLGFGKAASVTDLRNYTFAAFKRASQVAPRSADAWIGMGGVALETGVEFKDAVADFEKAVQCDPKRTDFYTDYANALRQNGQWERAEQVLRQRLAVDKSDAMAHYLLALVLMDFRPTPDRLKESESESHLALQFSPNNPLVNVQLGKIYLSSGRTSEGLAAIQQAVAVHPLDYKANMMLARAYRRAGNEPLAEKVSQKAAGIYHDLERIKVLESLERKNPQDIKVRQELAVLYTNTGNEARAGQERNIIEMMKANPGKAEVSSKAFADDLHEVLPTY